MEYENFKTTRKTDIQEFQQKLKELTKNLYSESENRISLLQGSDKPSDTPSPWNKYLKMEIPFCAVTSA